MLNPLGQRAIDKLDLSNGKRILDIGCGCGATTLEIAKMIPDGKIIGVDISEPMLNQARKDALEMSLSNTEFVVQDVQTDEISKDLFDIAFSRFGVMFFEDSYEAFKNINNALKIGGQLSFVCWQEPLLNPWQSLSIQVIFGRFLRRCSIMYLHFTVKIFKIIIVHLRLVSSRLIIIGHQSLCLSA